jgi:N-acetylglucosaminyldiphosphoundecaprenol N-acetyl-beta-D-mannosaminyltransferase
MNTNDYRFMNGTWRVDVLGSRISAVDAQEALRLVGRRLETGEGGYVCFTNVHAVVMGRQDAEFQRITNSSYLSVADGKPVYWTARTKGPVGHVPGPDFMRLVVERYPARKHFFYGSTDAVLARLIERLRREVPGLEVAGSLSPPFRVLSDSDKSAHYDQIRSSGAEIVWVGLGAPKQERWMCEAAASLTPAVLLGVGAAFDFHAQMVGRAPAVMREWGFEWLHRLASEPRRLWRRYLTTNSLFVAYLLQEFWRERRRSSPDSRS